MNPSNVRSLQIDDVKQSLHIMVLSEIELLDGKVGAS